MYRCLFAEFARNAAFCVSATTSTAKPTNQAAIPTQSSAVIAAAAFMVWRYALLRPWVAATTVVYLLYWVYVFVVWA